ncbi:MAG: general secretion pathway protein GspK [Candidatus Omnitrophica bacterium]|nr:general secretion pathway protein GspK [Candidatus Omnitrophota bacterium]
MNRRGSVFILVIWSLLFLGILAVGLSRRVFTEIELAAFSKTKVQARSLALAATKIGEQALLANKNPYIALNQFWSTGKLSEESPSAFRNIPLGEGEFSIRVYKPAPSPEEPAFEHFGLIDEERKLNINTADAKSLETLIRKVTSLDLMGANTLANSIVDWRDQDTFSSPGGAEDGYYSGLDPSYECKDAPFQVLEELHFVRGMTPQVFTQLEEFVTVFGNGVLNINTVGEDTLVALGLEESIVSRIVNYRRGLDQRDGSSDDKIFESAGSIGPELLDEGILSEEEAALVSSLASRGAIGVSSEHFALHAEGKADKRVKRIVCVMNRDGNVLSWRE